MRPEIRSAGLGGRLGRRRRRIGRSGGPCAPAPAVRRRHVAAPLRRDDDATADRDGDRPGRGAGAGDRALRSGCAAAGHRTRRSGCAAARRHNDHTRDADSDSAHPAADDDRVQAAAPDDNDDGDDLGVEQRQHRRRRHAHCSAAVQRHADAVRGPVCLSGDWRDVLQRHVGSRPRDGRLAPRRRHLLRRSPHRSSPLRTGSCSRSAGIPSAAGGSGFAIARATSSTTPTSRRSRSSPRTERAFAQEP